MNDSLRVPLLSGVQRQALEGNFEARVPQQRPLNIGNQPIPRHPRVAINQGRQQINQPSGLKRRFGAFFVGVGVAVLAVCKLARLAVAVGTLGISEALIKGGSKLGNAIYNKCTGRQNIPRDGTFQINVPPHGPVRLSNKILPNRLPSGMRIEDLHNRIQTKITDGHQLLQNLINDNVPNRRCTSKDMTDIMFYLQTRGEAKVGNFSQGAFSIPDPGNRIKNFLDTCTEAYQRESSHVGGFQRMAGGKHRGIDADGSANKPNELLPYGRKTLLYGALQSNPDLRMPHDRLWLKLESHGCWLTSPKGSRDPGGPGRTAQWHDSGAFLGHALSFISTRGKGDLAGSFKERIPSNLKNRLNEMAKQAPQHFKDILLAGNPTDNAKGIRFMHENATQALAALEEVPVREMEPLIRDLRQFVHDLEQYGNVNVRIGNEVVLNADEF